jgi:integrase
MPCPRVGRTEARYLAASEVAAILTAAEGLRYQSVLALIAATGLRRGEALALCWEHVNLNDGTLKVAATLDSVGGEMLITKPKSPRARRTIPLSPAVIAILKAQRATQAAERLHAGNQWTDSGLVRWPTCWGTAAYRLPVTSTYTRRMPPPAPLSTA